jgi:hypothetical protein
MREGRVLNHAACILATPGFEPPFVGTPAGSLHAGWLGLSVVGFEPFRSHPLGNIDQFLEVFTSFPRSQAWLVALIT